MNRVNIDLASHSGVVIPFVDRTDRYGRAEFQICPVYKYGKLRECYIYPRQQPGANEYYVWTGKADGYSFTGYEELDYPKIWMNGWCNEHKCNTVQLYVPPDSKYLWIHVSLQSLCIDFRKTKDSIKAI